MISYNQAIELLLCKRKTPENAIGNINPSRKKERKRERKGVVRLGR
jgi:hypothetical protein